MEWSTAFCWTSTCFFLFWHLARSIAESDRRRAPFAFGDNAKTDLSKRSVQRTTKLESGSFLSGSFSLLFFFFVSLLARFVVLFVTAGTSYHNTVIAPVLSYVNELNATTSKTSTGIAIRSRNDGALRSSEGEQ